MNREKKYSSSRNLIEDISIGYKSLESKSSVEAYRLMQISLIDVVKRYVANEKTDVVFFESGKLAGKNLYDKFFYPTKDLRQFITQLQATVKDLKIGILDMEKIDLEEKEFTFTISEGLECSNTSELDFDVCTFNEGFIASIFECFAKVPFNVKEIDCLSRRSRNYRFSIKATKGKWRKLQFGMVYPKSKEKMRK